MVRETSGWRLLETGAPDIARLGMERLTATHVALLGTLRRDGSPRISPVEPYLVEDHLLVGAMAWSEKVKDLRRDPRYVLHSAVTGPDTGEGELKIYGSAVESPAIAARATNAWWTGWPADKAVVFSLQIDQAVLIEWDLEQGLMAAHRWSPRDGYTRTSRTYP